MGNIFLGELKGCGSWRTFCEMPLPDAGKLTEVSMSFLPASAQMYRLHTRLLARTQPWKLADEEVSRIAMVLNKAEQLNENKRLQLCLIQTEVAGSAA